MERLYTMAMKMQKIINICFVILITGVFAYFIFGELFLPSEKLDYAYFCTEYTGEWERVTKSGEREPVEVPGRCEAGRNETVVMETKLPAKIDNDRYLCFKSAKQEMKFYIDGELRQEYSTAEGRLFGKLSAVAFVFLEINPEDEGKVLRVETQTDSRYSGFFHKVYYGNPIGVWKLFFDKLGLELLVAFVTFILSIVAIIGSMALSFCYRRRVALVYLGFGILVAAVWLITNSTFRQFMFPNLSIINDITFLMIMLLTLPYMLYMDEIQKGRYRKAYQVMEGIIIANFILCSFLHITKLCDFTDTIRYISVFCVLSILLVIATILIDVRRDYIREYIFVAVGMFGVCFAAFIQIIVYFYKIDLFNGVILSVGLIFLLVFSTISTIHEIMHMEREKQMALQASEAKGRFLANMSHEIRTPINAVLGMDAMILRESSEARIREYALDIQNAGRTLLSLINDILDFSKIESGKTEIIPVDYDFSSLIHDIMNMIEMKARDKGLKINLSIDEKMPSRFWGDDVRLRQILVNIMSNAVKYTEKGSVTLTVSSVIIEDIAELTFRVEDTGIGIREEDMEKLFSEFERIDEEKNRNIEGTGLGMSITTQLLERMGSRLKAESEYGKGTVFYFTLKQQIMNHEPVGDLEKRIKNQASDYSYQVAFTAPDAHVLVVDDNAINRSVFTNLLKPTKINVDEASGGEQCLELVRGKAYDMIFLDHMMPDLDGIQVLHKMRDWEDYPCKSSPVIALTANAVTGAREMYLKEGFHGFLSKPINPEKLEKMIMKTLPKEKVVYGESSVAVPEDGAGGKAEEDLLPELEGIDWGYARLHCRELPILKDTVKHFYGTMEAEALQLEEFLQGIVKGGADNSKENANQDIMSGRDIDVNYQDDASGRDVNYQYTVSGRDDVRHNDANEAIKHFRIKVHSMKNSAAMIGAVPLSGIARLLEYAARDGDISIIENITPVFLKEWEKMREILRPVVGTEDAGGVGQTPDYAFTKELLRLLMNAMEEMDVDTADEIINQLKRYKFSDYIMAEVMENLRLAVADLDEEQAAVWIGKFENEISNGL